jgi:hypothetical protein
MESLVIVEDDYGDLFVDDEKTVERIKNLTRCSEILFFETDGGFLQFKKQYSKIVLLDGYRPDPIRDFNRPEWHEPGFAFFVRQVFPRFKCSFFPVALPEGWDDWATLIAWGGEGCLEDAVKLGIDLSDHLREKAESLGFDMDDWFPAQVSYVFSDD